MTTTDRLIIVGDRVQHIREEIVYEAGLDALAPHLITRLPTTLPVLPQHPTRFIHFDPQSGRGLMIVETAPKLHTMIVSHRASGRYPEDARRRNTADGLSRFRVQLPWQYFAYGFTVNMRDGGEVAVRFTVDQSFLFWAPRPIRTPEDQIFIAHCPNVDSAGSICWGGTQSDSTSLSARIDDLVNNFFTTIFNEDLGHRTPFGTSLTQWETNSTDPLAFLNWEIWNEAGRTPAQVYEHMFGAPPPNIAEMNPAFVALPELPRDFTTLRAKEWLEALGPGAQRRIRAALTLVDTPEADTEEDALAMEAIA